MTLKVIHRLQALSNTIRWTFVQHSTRFQLTACSHGSSALAKLLVKFLCTSKLGLWRTIIYRRIGRKVKHIYFLIWYYKSYHSRNECRSTAVVDRSEKSRSHDLRGTLMTYFCIFVYTSHYQSAYWYQTWSLLLYPFHRYRRGLKKSKIGHVI